MKEIIDLTYPIQEKMLRFDAPWHPEVSIKQLGSIDTVGRETRQISFGTHAGTHIDAPRHFVKKGKTIDQIPLDVLMGEVGIVDFSFLEENGFVTVEMLRDVKLTKRIIFKFGWGKYWGDSKYYKGYPFFTKEAADYLVSGGVVLVGLDTPSPDDSRIKLGSLRDSEIHKIFLTSGVILLEYLGNMEKIMDYNGWHIIAMPIKIENGDGAPSRVCIYR